MASPFAKRLFSTALSFLLLLMVEPFEALGQQSNGYSGQGAPYTADELHQIVAPIALYPDALVAQILGASTFPDQVSAASGWLKQNSYLTGTDLVQAVDYQPWDPSVKALTQFPSVLDNLAKNLAWTSALGEAYHNQATDVMVAIQVLRAQAQAAGNLKSGQQIVVVQQSPDVIIIQPANPQVVYVPVYNPTVVYGVTYVTPGYSTAYVSTAAVAFGVGIAVGVAMSNSYSYSYWNCNWHGGAVVYKSNVYYGNSAWHGGYYGSTATAYGPNGVAHASSGYNPSTGTYARGASTTTAYGTQAVGQAYNPSTGAYGATHQASNAYGNYGSSVVSKDGQTAYTQHQTTSQGSVGTVQTSNGASGIAASGANGNAAAGQTANGNKYATANGNAYSNTGSGWQQTQGTSKSSSSYSGNSYSGSNSSAAKSSPSSYSSGGGSGSSAAKGSSSYSGGGYSGADKGSSSAFSSGGGDGWQSRGASSRGSASRGGGGGWGGRR